MDDHPTDPTLSRVSAPEAARVPDRPPSRAERRAETAHMVAVLSQALATQIDRLVTSADPAPDGWWFGPRAGEH